MTSACGAMPTVLGERPEVLAARRALFGAGVDELLPGVLPPPPPRDQPRAAPDGARARGPRVAAAETFTDDPVALDPRHEAVRNAAVGVATALVDLLLLLPTKHR